MSAPALLLLSLAVAGSARIASLLYAGLTISAAVGGPPLGVLLDRATHPGRLLAAALAGYAGGLAALTVSLGHLPVAVLIGTAVAAGLLAPALTGGWTSRLADVIPGPRLDRGHALDAASYNLASLAGPALAAITAAAAGPRWAMAAVIALLLLAAPAAASLPAQAHLGSGTGPPAALGLVADLRAGAAAIVRTPALRRITVASTIAYLGVGMFVVTCPLLGSRFLGGAAHGALLLSVLAAASLLATAGTARWPAPLSPDTIFMIATAVAGCGLAALAFASSAGWIIGLVAVTGLADGPQLAAVFAVRQRDAPPLLRGQIFTTAASMKISAGAVGAALAGLLAQQSLTIVLAAAATAQAAALAVASGHGRSARQTRSRMNQGATCQPALNREGD
jgi:hypothetical protein